jgi:hypothetical protein
MASRTLAASLLLACIVICINVGCGRGKRIEVSVQFQGKRIWVSAEDSKGVMGREFLYFSVEDRGRVWTIQLDDDVTVTQMKLVQYGDWVLAVNGDLVLGGLRLSDGVLVGEAEWSALPFTIWAGGGQVLASGRLRANRPSDLPAAFIIRREPRATTNAS